MAAVVNNRGQVTIDRATRKKLGVRPGMVAVQQVVGGQLVITFIPGPHRRSAAGVLGAPSRPVPKSWEEIRDAAERAAAEDEGHLE